MTGWNDCDGSGDGSDANGCEIQSGATCSIGGSVGTYQGCSCVIPDEGANYFKAGSKTVDNLANSLLWGKQEGSGNLIQFENSSSSDTFVVTNEGSVKLGNQLSSHPSSTLDLLYNLDGSLYWNGALVSNNYIAGRHLSLNGQTFDVDVLAGDHLTWDGDTISVDVTAGDHLAWGIRYQ